MQNKEEMIELNKKNLYHTLWLWLSCFRYGL